MGRLSRKYILIRYEKNKVDNGEINTVREENDQLSKRRRRQVWKRQYIIDKGWDKGESKEGRK